MSSSARVRETAGSGHIGVAFFYVLSGFVLTWSWRPGRPVLDYYRGRLARIYPLHALTWAIALVVAFLVAGRPPWRQIFAPLTLLHSWTPDIGVVFAVNAPSWSLSDEAFFYALLPALVPLASRVPWRTSVGAAVGCVVASTMAWPLIGAELGGPLGDWFVYIFPMTRLTEFILGVVIARAVIERRPCPISVSRTVALLVGAMGLVPFVGATWRPVAVTVVPFALLIWAVAQRDAEGRDGGALHQPWLTALGRWSFALYLIHNIVVTVWLSRTGRVDASGLALAAVSITAISVALAAAAHRFIEIPAERALRGTRGSTALVSG